MVRALIDGRMVSCTFISVLTQMYEWWYGKSSTLAIRNACTTSHVPCSYLGVSYFDVEKNYFSWDTFRCIYFSAWPYFHPPLICKKSRQLLENSRLDSFPKVHGFSMPIETLLKTHAHARLRHLLSYVFKKTGNSRKKMCWIPRKDLMEIPSQMCLNSKKRISWRTIPDVLNSKKRSHDVPSQMCWIPRKDLNGVPSHMCWIPRKDLMTYHPRCVEFQEKISWRTIPDVLNSKKRSHDVPSQMCVEFQEKISWRTIPDVLNSKKRSHERTFPDVLNSKKGSHDVLSQMCWIPRKDLMTYHPRCVEFQEKISWHNIPDVFKSKERYYTPPPPPTPHPPTNTTPKKNNKKRQKKRFHWGETQKKNGKSCALAVAPVQWTSKNTVSWRGLLRAPSQLHSTTLHCTKLHYTTVHDTTLHSTTLLYTTLVHYTTFHYTSLHYTTLHSTTLQLQLHSTKLHYTNLHYAKLHYTTLSLHCTTLHSTTLHYTTLQYTKHCIRLDDTAP